MERPISAFRKEFLKNLKRTKAHLSLSKRGDEDRDATLNLIVEACLEFLWTIGLQFLQKW